ncbi:hypothetical protein ACIG0D_01770 [Streptomyces sp. NPDC052773]|uniref:hypothetical protein n=1 Tax=Streptomyces sp. NPDC052773 TaxID=3365693 RepID=UPI0037D8F5BC
MSMADWGDVPTWIGAAGAMGAAWFAFQTITSQRQQIGEQQAFIAEQTRFMSEQRQNLELERAELRAAAEERRSAQAKQVYMSARKSGGEDDGAGGRVGHDHWLVQIRNSSDASITDVQVRFGTAYLAADVYENLDHYIESRRRGERWPHPLPLLGARRGAWFLSPRLSEATLDGNRPILYFTDDDGVRWSLDTYGHREDVSADGS